MLDTKKNSLMRIHMDEQFASETLALAIANICYNKRLIIVCVGTDRSTGDSLGPLIGSKLSKSRYSGLEVFGTLDEPVHALNLDEYNNKLKSLSLNSVVLAIDACLGKSENVGYISLKKGPLKPGTGVNKKLPLIGDFHLIGVVNIGGLMEYFVLQNTRLSLVMKMSEIITEGIKLCCHEWIPTSQQRAKINS